MTRLFLVSLLVAACGGSRAARRAEGRYDVGEPGAGWDRVDPAGADHAWFHSELGASIYSDSNCATRYEDRPLPDLVRHLLFGVNNGSAPREEARAIDGREGLLWVLDGKTDGVTVRIGALVTKKDDCMYDMLYIAPPSRFEQGWPAFEAVVAGFSTKGS